jgi:hypothetical protein
MALQAIKKHQSQPNVLIMTQISAHVAHFSVDFQQCYTRSPEHNAEIATHRPIYTPVVLLSDIRLSLFRLLQWQLTHAASDEAHTAKAARMGASASWQSADAASPSVPTAALLPAQVAARLAAAMVAADDEAAENM